MSYKSRKYFLWLLVFFMSFQPMAYSDDVQDAMLFIHFSKAMGSLYKLKHEAEMYYVMHGGKLLTSEDQLRFNIDTLYYDSSMHGNGSELEALRSVVIERDGRLKIFLKKPYGVNAYYGFKPRFEYSKDRESPQKILKWDCITNMSPKIIKNLAGCDKDTSN